MTLFILDTAYIHVSSTVLEYVYLDLYPSKLITLAGLYSFIFHLMG